MIKTKEPKVTMVSCNKHQLQTITYAWDIMHKELAPWETYKKDKSLDSIVKQLNVIKHSPHLTVFELVNFVFLIENVSRAFTHQLVRHRLASYVQQSQRVVNMGNFADEGRFTIPEGLSPEMTDFFVQEMFHIQDAYKEMVAAGCKTEQARGLLPTNVQTNIIVGINFRSLIHMLKLRLAPDTQIEFRRVAKLICDKLQEVHPFFKLVVEEAAKPKSQVDRKEK